MGYQGVTDIEYWRPSYKPGPGPPVGRPRVATKRRLVDYPAPTPQPTPCRLWQGAIDKDGYGTLANVGHGNTGLRRRKYRAHRWVYEAVHGPIPEGLVVRHKCDNRLCYRLSHLELGSIADNNVDASERGHAGGIRIIPPSEVKAIWARKCAGETWVSIRADYPQYSRQTIQRVKDYIKDVP